MSGYGAHRECVTLPAAAGKMGPQTLEKEIGVCRAQVRTEENPAANPRQGTVVSTQNGQSRREEKSLATFLKGDVAHCFLRRAM